MKLSEHLRQNADCMDAYEAGRPIEFFDTLLSRWMPEDRNPANWGVTTLHRPKPEPKTRPWSKPDDVPGPVCWIRETNGVKETYLIVCLYGSHQIAITTVLGHAVLRFEDLNNYEYSTDRKTWHNCEVTEE